MKTTPHKTRQSTIKWFMLMTTLAIIVAKCSGCAPKTGCPAIYKNGMKGYGIIQECHSDEGISVAYKDKEGKEWGLDYMTRKEYDSLLTSFN